MADKGRRMKPMELAMIGALAAIDAELGLPEDGCNSTARTLAAIKKLKAGEIAPSTRTHKIKRLSVPPRSGPWNLGVPLYTIECSDLHAFEESVGADVAALSTALRAILVDEMSDCRKSLVENAWAALKAVS